MDPITTHKERAAIRDKFQDDFDLAIAEAIDKDISIHKHVLNAVADGIMDAYKKKIPPVEILMVVAHTCTVYGEEARP